MSESAAAPRLSDLVASGASRQRIAEVLDALSPEERVRAATSLRGREVRRLYEACAEAPTPTLDAIVPRELGEDRTVIFEGRNSLLAFTSFQKRFARIDDAIVGYNHQTMSFLTGPGHFVVREPHADSDVPGELYFDYTATPARRATGFPPLASNETGLSRLVYAHMKDYMRTVATGVMVGAAYKHGVPQHAYFVLARIG